MADRRRMRKPPAVRTAPRSGFAIGPFDVAAVDAAKHEPAWALGRSGQLQACGFDALPGTYSLEGWLSDPETDSGLVEPTVCALELSRSYGARDAGKHGDIIAETCGGALCAGSMRAGRVVLVHPDEWAGTASAGKGKAKPVRHSAIWKVLTVSERMLVARIGGFPDAYALERHIETACEAIVYGRTVRYTHKVHNLLDAVGLYLFAVGRIKRGCGTR